MKFFYQSYITAFQKYAEKMLLKFKNIGQIGWYAMLLTDKASELVNRAAKNSRIKIADLQKELYTIGRSYVNKFSTLHRKNRTSVPVSSGLPEESPAEDSIPADDQYERL